MQQSGMQNTLRTVPGRKSKKVVEGLVALGMMCDVYLKVSGIEKEWFRRVDLCLGRQLKRDEGF